MPRLRFLAPGIAAIALITGVACSSNPASPGSPADAAATQPPTTQPPATSAGTSTGGTSPGGASPSTSASGALSTADLVKLAEPAIVRIETPAGVGTGFVVDASGYIMTNFHVIASANGRSTATTIVVTTSDGAEHDATVVGTDATSDLALIRISATGLTALKLGSLANTVVGQDVVAIGFALDLARGEGPSFSVTRGIVSAKNRAIEETSEILGSIQTDAAINHGNSGGPLLNLFGEVVGVNTAIAPDTTTGGSASGIGFAVGVDTVKAVYEELRAHGRVDRALLGIRNFEALRPAKAKELGVPQQLGGVYLAPLTGIQVRNAATVDPAGPAGSAGLKAGDVITRIGEFAIHNESDLVVAMIRHQPGDTVSVEFYRDGQKMTVTVTLGSAATG